MSSSDVRDERWFTGLYADHYPNIVRYGLRRLGDVEASAELAQEVFVVAWRRRDQVPDHGLPWLYGVARRLLANERRARRRRPVPLPLTEPDAVPQDAGAAQPDSVAAIADLRAALATLPDLDQEILRLIGWEQLTAAEAGAALGCSRTAAAVRLHRARRRLAAALAAANSTTTASSSPAVARGY
jgi:RNA polymerase sigma-70 factor (ECF subfamily)